MQSCNLLLGCQRWYWSDAYIAVRKKIEGLRAAYNKRFSNMVAERKYNQPFANPINGSGRTSNFQL